MIKSSGERSSVAFLHLLLQATPSVTRESTDWLTVVAALASLAAVTVATLALLSDRTFRRRDALSRLLERFESGAFFVLIWHLEQAMRKKDAEAWSLDPCDIDELKSGSPPPTQRLISRALGQDYDDDRAAMHEFHFFALRVHEWIAWTWWTRFLRPSRTRLINNTFGYQLLSTLLDHRVVALRMRKTCTPEPYYPTQYGCLEGACLDLVEMLANDFLGDKRRRKPHEDIQHPLAEKLRVTQDRLNDFLPPREQRH